MQQKFLKYERLTRRILLSLLSLMHLTRVPEVVGCTVCLLKYFLFFGLHASPLHAKRGLT